MSAIMPDVAACDTGSVPTFVDLVAASGSTLVDESGQTIPAAGLVPDGLRVAGWLRSSGVAADDRIAIRMPNQIDYLRLLIACAASGVVAVSVNTRYSRDEVADLVARSGARLVEHLDPSWPDHEAVTIDPEICSPDAPFVVFTTSGTTSRPKMVLHRQHSIVDHAHDVAAGFGYGPSDIALVVMPWCGTFGLASLTGALAAGSRIVVANFEVAATAALIERERVTCVNGSDDMFHRLLEHSVDISSIRLAGVARFNTSLDGIVERAQRAGATLTGLYGMSEVQALYSLRDPSGDATERERPGGTLVSAGAACRVVDGELQLRGPSLFAGYLAEGGAEIDAELTGRHFDDGWFRTGDLAEAEGDRTFEYVSRLGDVLRLGGFLVSPAEIEAVLVEIDGVFGAQVVAVARPDGARPVAFVIAPDGVDEDAAIARCRERLARYKVPIRVIPIDEFPTTASANGTKIQKVRLRELADQLVTG
jgi:fatty-acyl-CoA synthase